MKIKTFLSCLINRAVLICLAIGIILNVITLHDTIVSFKEPVDFEHILEKEISVGDHVEGDILYIWDCVATEDTYTEKNGSKTVSKDTARYYDIPAWSDDVTVVVRVNKGDISAMEKLKKESYEFFEDGETVPTHTVKFSGVVKEMKDDVKKITKDYLKKCEYTDAQIEKMELFVIETRNFVMMRILTAVGIALIIVGIIILTVLYRKAMKANNAMNSFGYTGEGNLNGYGSDSTYNMNGYTGDYASQQNGENTSSNDNNGYSYGYTQPQNDNTNNNL